MPKILDVLKNPNPILRKKSKNVNLDILHSSDFLQLCGDMAATMLKKDGVGLAAPQIGKNIRLIAIHYNNKTNIIINPVIVKKSWAKTIAEEGCLSVPGVFGNVSRHKKITCNYIDIDGKRQKLIAKDMLARILQHEIDHLDGVLFIDKMESAG